jgi:hypothetical protein
MKQKSLYSFFLEIVFSLILLTIATIVSLLLFANAAKIDQTNNAVTRITNEMVKYSELLRSSDDAYRSSFDIAASGEKAYFFGYDANGEAAKEKVVYQLAIYIQNETKGSQTLRKCRLELVDLRDGSIVTGWHVSTLTEVQP